MLAPCQAPFQRGSPTEQKMNTATIITATIITATTLTAILITTYYQQSHLSGPPSRR